MLRVTWTRVNNVLMRGTAPYGLAVGYVRRESPDDEPPIWIAFRRRPFLTPRGYAYAIAPYGGFVSAREACEHVEKSIKERADYSRDELEVLERD